MANKPPEITNITPQYLRTETHFEIHISVNDKLVFPLEAANAMAVEITGGGSFNDGLEHIALWIEKVNTLPNGPLSELPRLIRNMKR